MRLQAVMLSHGNLLYQVENLDFFLPVQPSQCTLSLLPPWHVYERAVAVSGGGGAGQGAVAAGCACRLGC